jgi:hypothetical protein
MFRFTIRELLLVTVIVAGGVGWCLDHTYLRWRLRNSIDSNQQLVRSVESLHYALHRIDPTKYGRPGSSLIQSQ